MASWRELQAPSIVVVLWIRAFYVGSAGIGILLGLVPALRKRYMDYGVRTQVQQRDQPKSSTTAVSTTFTHLVDALLTLEVPHRYFLHYYVLSVTSSLFWGYQLWYQGWAIGLLSRVNAVSQRLDGMTANQVWLCWTLMALQGARRLYESIVFLKPTNAKMPLPIYAIGLAFYTVTNIAVWIEGADSILKSKNETRPLSNWTSPRSQFWLFVFLLASASQFACHRHLASLRKYSLPTHALFRYVVCPHYLAECLIYIAIAGLAAPTGRQINLTLLSVVGFVGINLGVVANSTREWWRAKFGNAATLNRWRMLPPIW